MSTPPFGLNRLSSQKAEKQVLKTCLPILTDPQYLVKIQPSKTDWILLCSGQSAAASFCLLDIPAKKSFQTPLRAMKPPSHLTCQICRSAFQESYNLCDTMEIEGRYCHAK